MRKQMIMVILSAMFLVLTVNIAAAGKEHSTSSLAEETFEATVTPPMSEVDRVTIVVVGYSSGTDMQDLANTFRRRGNNGLRKAFSKIKKGYLSFGGTQGSTTLAVIKTSPRGSARVLTLVGLSPDRLDYIGGNGQVIVPFAHPGFPFLLVQLQVDESGKGQGVMFPSAKLTFDRKGEMVVNPWKKEPMKLVNVYLEK